MNTINPIASLSNEPAVIILSGGLDSSTLAYMMRSLGYALTALWFHYGQRHAKEQESARQIANNVQASFHTIDLASVGAHLGGNALTGTLAVPHGHYAAENMKQTVVPLRNALFLTAACAYALAHHIPTVAMGVHAGDHPIYPDCREEFFRAYQAMVDVFTEGHKLRIWAPFLHQTKVDIVTIGNNLGLPFAETWSCYEGGAVHCGLCGTCVERREAFRLAGIHDPTVYAAP